ncbi:MAG: double-strand break repair protein AddB [Alphaproteobacteria bacterium]|nr:double-strand break repair protein AddB [Alphaproteobacteria bacterium]
MQVLRDKPNVLNIPAGQSFADSLARGLLARAAQDPLALGDYLLLLPSRRACRTLRDAFLRLSGGQAIVLPRMVPVGDVEAEEVTLLLSGLDDGGEALGDIPDAVSKMERQILLAHALMKSGKAQSFDQAVSLAQDLGHFLDEVQTENLSFDGLAKLVPDAFAGHWQQTLNFLETLTRIWPEILQSRGVIDSAARRNLLLAAQETVWRHQPPAYPVIAAGSTGTVPAARALLALVAHLPQGELVLPGLDTGLDEDSWAQIGEDHPQYNIKKLLAAAGAARADVGDWPLRHETPVNHARVRLLSEAMRPAETTERWRQLTPHDIPQTALDGLTRIDCDTPQEEADVIALILREALQTPGKTAALITPDRRLARRVTLSMRRWGIDIDDSGGQPLTELPVGAWLMLCAEMAEQSLAPIALLSLLKHPVMAAGIPADDMRRMTYTLDQMALRGPRPSAGFAGLRAAIEKLAGEKQQDNKKDLLAWLDKIEPIATPFMALMEEGAEKPFRQILEAHIKLAEDLAATTESAGASRLWLGEAGEGASQLLQQLLAAALDVPPLAPAHYVPLLRMLMKSVTVRPRYGMHPRLSILGQVEARLYCADMVILGGLNEGTWPALPAHDPWMSRPMRRDFGLPSPEKALSLAAHDFVQAASAPEVILTRAQKVDGTPTVPARWLLRIDAVLEAVGLALPQAAGQRYRQWRQDMDTPAAIQPAPRPAPTPPLHARPRQLSVTRIETWMRDPYQIYAQYILNLRAFDPIDADPGGAERGTFIHAALEKFIDAYPDVLPPDAEHKLLSFGRESLVDLRVPQDVEAFWWPRFEKIAHEFVRQENEWRQDAKPFATEVDGKYEFAASGGPFTLSGKADRIDRMTAGGYAIIDYKSGGTPGKGEVRQGIAPQLPLEALMLRAGAFEGISAGDTAELMYWRVTGSGQKPVERVRFADGKPSIAEMTDAAAAGLAALVEKFDDPNTPYLSQPRAEAKPKFSDYEHLARVREWAVGGDDGEDGA